MTKQELIDAISAEQGISKADVGRVFDALPSAISTALQRGQEVTLRGLGTFSREDRAARSGRNPRTGEAIEIAARKAVKFKAAKALNEAVNS